MQVRTSRKKKKTISIIDSTRMMMITGGILRLGRKIQSTKTKLKCQLKWQMGSSRVLELDDFKYRIIMYG